MSTNNERAERGRSILEIYAIHYGDPSDYTANLTDILADLMHTAAKRPELGLNFDDRLRMARWHYEVEVEEEHDVQGLE